MNRLIGFDLTSKEIGYKRFVKSPLRRRLDHGLDDLLFSHEVFYCCPTIPFSQRNLSGQINPFSGGSD
ncbi:MAG TPA: hypothetical protein VK638_26855 [Edaphobacter sp.]|nr:hypothetical protein [Edaphobacter sp.]